MIYRAGQLQPSSDPQHVVARAVWDWLPKHRRDLLLDKAFEAVRRANTPPHGEPFIGADGVPYSDPAQFAEDLSIEFRERLFQLLDAKADVHVLEVHA